MKIYCFKENVMAYAEAILIKFSCPFNFETFPFDSHECCLTYGDVGAGFITLSPAKIVYDNKTTNEG